jgi:uncharacterized protein
MTILISLVIFVGIALCGGFLSGLLGIGGNILIIPLLSIVFRYFCHYPIDQSMKMAIATAVVVMMFSAGSSAYNHIKHKNVVWSFYYKIAGFIVIGTILGASCVSLINGVILEKIFGIFLLILAARQFIVSKKKKPASDVIKNLSVFVSGIIGLVIGFKSGLLGIGGGVLLIPLLTYLNYKSTQVVGTTSICSTTVAVTAGIVFFIHGFATMHLDFNNYMLGYIYLPAVIVMLPTVVFAAKLGVKSSLIVPSHWFVKLLLALQVVFGIQMLF